jgi:hypothetical protein
MLIFLANSVNRQQMLVIDDNSGDGRIKDSNVKAQEEPHGEDACSKARGTGVCRGEGRW